MGMLALRRYSMASIVELDFPFVLCYSLDGFRGTDLPNE
jgi:hypothetical protein